VFDNVGAGPSEYPVTSKFINVAASENCGNQMPAVAANA